MKDNLRQPFKSSNTNYLPQSQQIPLSSTNNQNTICIPISDLVKTLTKVYRAIRQDSVQKDIIQNKSALYNQMINDTRKYIIFQMSEEERQKYINIDLYLRNNFVKYLKKSAFNLRELNFKSKKEYFNLMQIIFPQHYFMHTVFLRLIQELWFVLRKNNIQNSSQSFINDIYLRFYCLSTGFFIPSKLAVDYPIHNALKNSTLQSLFDFRDPSMIASIKTFINDPNHQGICPLVQAIRNNQGKEVEILLNNQQTIINVEHKIHPTIKSVYEEAIISNNQEILELVVQAQVQYKKYQWKNQIGPKFYEVLGTILDFSCCIKIECDSQFIPFAKRLSNSSQYSIMKQDKCLRIDTFQTRKQMQPDFSVIFNQRVNEGHMVIMDHQQKQAIDFFEMCYLSELTEVVQEMIQSDVLSEKLQAKLITKNIGKTQNKTLDKIQVTQLEQCLKLLGEQIIQYKQGSFSDQDDVEGLYRSVNEILIIQNQASQVQNQENNSQIKQNTLNLNTKSYKNFLINNKHVAQILDALSLYFQNFKLLAQVLQFVNESDFLHTVSVPIMFGLNGKISIQDIKFDIQKDLNRFAIPQDYSLHGFNLEEQIIIPNYDQLDEDIGSEGEISRVQTEQQEEGQLFNNSFRFNMINTRSQQSFINITQEQQSSLLNLTQQKRQTRDADISLQIDFPCNQQLQTEIIDDRSFLNLSNNNTSFTSPQANKLQRSLLISSNNRLNRLQNSNVHYQYQVNQTEPVHLNAGENFLFQRSPNNNNIARRTTNQQDQQYDMNFLKNQNYMDLMSRFNRARKQSNNQSLNVSSISIDGIRNKSVGKRAVDADITNYF
eukprot:403354379